MITDTDAHRDLWDIGKKPYRVRIHDNRTGWSYLKDSKGNLKKFASFAAACNAARSLTSIAA